MVNQKYLIRELMHRKYPEIPVLNKGSNASACGCLFYDVGRTDTAGVQKESDMRKFTGNQKWQNVLPGEIFGFYTKNKNATEGGNDYGIRFSTNTNHCLRK